MLENIEGQIKVHTEIKTHMEPLNKELHELLQ